MGAIPLHDDGIAITYQLDDGRQVKVARDAASRLGAPMPSVGTPSDAFDPTAGIAPPEAGVSPVAPPVAPPIAAPEPFSPPVQNSPDFASPPPGPALPAPTKPMARGAKAPAPIPAATQSHFGDVVTAAEDAEKMQQQAIQDRAIADQAGTQKVVNVLEDRNKAIDAQREKQLQDQESSMAEVQRRSQALDAAIEDHNKKTAIDPNRLSKSMGTGGRALQILFQAITGLGHALKGEGGKNPAIDMWLAAKSDDIRLQMDAREASRAHLGDMKDSLSRFKDLAQSRQGMFSVAMAAETDKAAKMLEQIAAQTKNDTVRANALESSALLKEHSAAFKGEWAKNEFQADMQVKALKEQIRSAKASEGLGWANNALANKKFEQDKTEFNWTKEYQQKNLDLEARKLEAAGNKKGGEELRKFGVGAPTTVEKMPDGTVVRNPDGTPKTRAGQLTNKDGTPFLARTEAQAEKIGNKIAVAGEVNDIISEVLSIRDKSGGASSLWNSDEAQRLKVLQDRLVVLAKQGTEGMSSDADMERLANTLGAGDILSFRERAAGLEEARKRTQVLLNRELKNTYQYDGDPITFDNPYAVDANPADEAYKSVKSGKTQSQMASDAKPGRVREFIGEGVDFATGGAWQTAKEDAKAIEGGEGTSAYGVDPSAQKGLDVLARDLRSKDQGTATNAATKVLTLIRERPEMGAAIVGTLHDQSPGEYIFLRDRGLLPQDAVQTIEGRANALRESGAGKIGPQVRLPKSRAAQGAR